MSTTLISECAIDAIAEEHHELEALYERICNTLADRSECLETVRDLFQEMAQRVRRHFENEEQGGYFREIVELAPRCADKADQLEREHAELMEVAEQLARDIRHARETQVWRLAIRLDFENFIRRCEEHEAAETELVQEAYLQDIGAQD